MSYVLSTIAKKIRWSCLGERLVLVFITNAKIRLILIFSFFAWNTHSRKFYFIPVKIQLITLVDIFNNTKYACHHSIFFLLALLSKVFIAFCKLSSIVIWYDILQTISVSFEVFLFCNSTCKKLIYHFMFNTKNF